MRLHFLQHLKQFLQPLTITSCAIIIVFCCHKTSGLLQLLKLLLGFSSQVHQKPLPSNCSYAGDLGKKISPERLNSLFGVFGILPHLGNTRSSEGTRYFSLLGQF